MSWTASCPLRPLVAVTTVVSCVPLIAIEEVCMVTVTGPQPKAGRVTVGVPDGVATVTV